MHFLTTTNPFLIYGVVALVLLLESAGIPILNSTLLLLIGALCAMDRLGHLNLIMAWLSSTAGSIAGAWLAYSIGRRKGMAFLLRLARILHVDEQRLLLIERWGHSSGPWMIFFSRMIPYVRPFACFPAGIARMRPARFLLAASCGSCIWCFALLMLGWLLGPRSMLFLRYSQQYTLPFVIALLVAVMFAWFAKRWLQQRIAARLRTPVESEKSADTGDLLHV